MSQEVVLDNGCLTATSITDDEGVKTVGNQPLEHVRLLDVCSAWNDDVVDVQTRHHLLCNLSTHFLTEEECIELHFCQHLLSPCLELHVLLVQIIVLVLYRADFGLYLIVWPIDEF